ncbi:MAG: DNA-processing protein DprA, partial [Candidatus Kapabacteria bacterium]|nr:DNA-processing protein DprA [Candidatus Kapabacteria bacterium]
MLPNSWTLQEVVALSLSSRITATEVRHLVERYSSLGELLANESGLAQRYRLDGSGLFSHREHSPLLDRAKHQLDRCADLSVQIVHYWDDAYPSLLREIFYPPTLLYVHGRLQPPDAAAIAIVGTRHCTEYGKMVTEQYAECFASAGIVVVSGLATGIDTYAHKATLKHGGITYAVVASGVDKINTGAQYALAQEIVTQGGAVLSEYPCGTSVQRAYFPRRNRIISGLACGTLVVESGERGGSLITAQFALDQNRELFAVPGRIYSERSKGTNLLIQRSQAQLTLTPHDIL